MNSQQKEIIVIGAGISGLAAAAKLAKLGHKVTILEKNSQPGGRIATFTEEGFTFDMGPTWFMMPDVFTKYFAELGEDMSEFIQLQRLKPSYRAYFPDSTFVDISAKLQENLELFESIEPGAGANLTKYLNDARLKYGFGMTNYVYRVFNSIFDALEWKLLSKMFEIGLLASFDSYVKEYFKSPKLIQLLEFMVIFMGCSPQNLPALYTLISHADLDLGIWYPKGGMHGVALGMEKLCIKLGVEIKYNTEVSKIDLIRTSQEKALTTAEGTFTAPTVICSGDYPNSEINLLAKKNQTYPQSFWNKKTLSPSALIFYLGVETQLKNVLHHTLFFSEDWDKHFESIFQKREWPNNPIYYLCDPSKTDPNVAPKGMETVVLLIPVASGLTDTEEIREKYFNEVMTDLEKKTQQDIRSHIVLKRSFCVNDFASKYNAFKGNAFGLAHTLFQSAVFRPSYKSKKVPGLYYCGHFATPGVGLPMGLISGQVIADVVDQQVNLGNN